MIELNGQYLCEKCFLPLTQQDEVCPHCKPGSNVELYLSALPEKTILQGRYIVGKVLGKGGFGVTYLCYDSKLEKRVAIKEYLPDSLIHRNSGETEVSFFSGEKEQSFLGGALKFYEEAKRVSRFNGNPNIISVYEFFYENNTAYYVMEYLVGEDLKHCIARHGGRIRETQAMFIAKQMCEVLFIVHSLGVLHRDISPDNIFICDDGTLKLIDFGAARQIIGEETNSLSVILKQGFAPLEQYQKHGNQGPWTDLYALGATLYYAITGNVIDDAMTRVTEDSLDMTGISPAFGDVLRFLLVVDIKHRCQSAVELKRMLDHIEISAEPLTGDGAVSDLTGNETQPVQTYTGSSKETAVSKRTESVITSSAATDINDAGKQKKKVSLKQYLFSKPVIIAAAALVVFCVACLIIIPKNKVKNYNDDVVTLPVEKTMAVELPEGIPSDSCLAEYYTKNISSGEYSVSFTFEMDGETVQGNLFVDGTDSAFREKSSGIGEIGCIFRASRLHLYMSRDTWHIAGYSDDDLERLGLDKSEIGTYLELSETEDEEQWNEWFQTLKSLKNLFSVTSNEFVSRKNEIRNGTKYVCEVYSTANGMIQYYFSGEDLVFIDNGKTIYSDFQFSSFVPFDAFSAPKGYRDVSE